MASLNRSQHSAAATSCSSRPVAAAPKHVVAAPRGQQHVQSRSPHEAGKLPVGRATSTVVSFQNNDMTVSVSDLTASTSSTDALSGVQTSKTLSWAGAGIFFFWQLGAIKYLAERFDLTQVPMVGASGGALASVLGACGVPTDRVLQHAYDLSIKYNIWERPLGLLGVWGRLIEQWLDDLLPADAAERCRGRVTIVVTTLPTMEQIGISDFKDKQDLINCAMASSHIPLFLDYKFSRYCRNKFCVDGSFPDFFINDNSELLKNGGMSVMFDYFMDKNLPRKGRLDMIEVKTYEEVCHIMQLGYEYAAGLHREGHLDHLEVGEMAMDHLDAAERH